MHALRKLAPAALIALAACGSQVDEAGQSDADAEALSATTYSMEMVRKNPALLPGVEIPEGRHVNGRPAPADRLALRMPRHEPGSFLYAANQLDQFLKLADPAVYPSDKSATAYSRQPGDLFAHDGELTWDQVEQGALGDCYFASSLSAALFAQGKALAHQLIQPRTVSGKVVSYFVYFFQASGKKVKIEVDPDLLHSNKSGHIYYMDSTDNLPGYEEWAPSLIEKAYAQWHGSYKAIGDGGTAADAIYAITGKKTKAYSPTAAATVTAIEAAGKTGKAQVACTFGDHDGVKYDGTGIYSDHCYTLRGVRRAGASVFIQLRNPWGPVALPSSEPSEPQPGDGNDDGIFDLELSQFQKLYASVDIVK